MPKRVDPPFLDGWRHVSPTVRKPCPCGPEPYRLYEPAPNPYCGCGAAFSERGGRFNLPGYRTLYLCSTLKCCIAEFNKGSLWALPRHVFSYVIRIENMLDLTTQSGLSEARATESSLVAEGWGDTQTVGMHAYNNGYQAIRAPSSTGVDHLFAVFLDSPVFSGVYLEATFEETWKN